MLPSSVSVTELSRPGVRRGVVTILVATTLYATVVTFAVLHGWRHYEWLALGFQALVLLPALAYGLRSHGGEELKLVPARGRFWAASVMMAFLIGSVVLSAINVKGTTIPDETAYRFQARILAAGRLVAPPPPGAAERPDLVPAALRFNHTILWREGWFAKYPLGWPAVLALPEKFGFGAVVNPLLAIGLLTCTFWIALKIDGPVVAFWAVALLAFSPYFLAQSVMLTSHDMAGLLLALACGVWLEGTRRLKLGYFALAALLIGLAVHVRPLTALLTGLTLAGATLIVLRKERRFLIRASAVCGLIGALIVGSVLLYNRAFTGDLWLSPYAFIRGVKVPVEISASLSKVLHNLTGMWRFSLQSTLAFTFPLIWMLALVGFYKNRKAHAVNWVLLALFPLLILGYLVEPEPLSSVIGERYWFEGYFAVAILGAQGIVAILKLLKPARTVQIAAACALLAAQVAVSYAAAKGILQQSWPSRAVAGLADQYRDCRCVVFLESSPPLFYAQHLNLNGPDWREKKVFYAIDPGAEQRLTFTRNLGRDRFYVIGYDPARRSAKQE